MKTFEIEVEVMGIMGLHRKIIRKNANHLQGAIRQIYQDEKGLINIISIIQD